MIYTTSGEKKSRAISAESVKEQLLGQLIFHSEEKAVVDVLNQLLDDMDKLPTLNTIEGKKVHRAYYPRIMVKDNCRKDAEAFRIGGNSHHQLEVKHGDNSSHISFINIQCMVGTDYADEGYTFVGEKPFEEMDDDTEVVPFDEVWVEEETEEQNG